MSGLVLTVTSTHHEALGGVERLGREFSDARKRAVAKWGAITGARITERVNRIKSAQTFSGAKAKQRREAYWRRVEAGGLGDDFLFVRTGALRASVTKAPAPEPDGLNWLVRVGFRKGAAEKYAPVHEFGSKKMNIPARAPVHKAVEERRQQGRDMLDAEIHAVCASFGVQVR